MKTLRFFVRGLSKGRIATGSIIARYSAPKNGRYIDITPCLGQCCTDVSPNDEVALLAKNYWVRVNDQGKIVSASVIERKEKPAGEGWRNINACVSCCSYIVAPPVERIIDMSNVCPTLTISSITGIPGNTPIPTPGNDIVIPMPAGSYKVIFNFVKTGSPTFSTQVNAVVGTTTTTSTTLSINYSDAQPDTLNVDFSCP